MKICSYLNTLNQIPQKRLGILIDDQTIIDPNLSLACEYQREGRYDPYSRANHRLPSSLFHLLNNADNPFEAIEEGYATYLFLQKLGIDQLKNGTPISYRLDEPFINLTTPLDKIATYRDFYAHEKHVATGFKKRNEPIPPAWYEIPAYYKGATEGFIGHGEEILWPSYTKILDYELELAVVIGKCGQNIKESYAIDHIFGLTILNDISARDIQKKEMAVRLGPAKGKDFCSVLGPVIVTMDEFDFKEPDLTMTATINGEEWSRGQSGDAHFSFSQMIQHVSQDEWVLPGDVFGSGTVGTGCGLELDKWIRPGDEINLTVEKIGTLKNIVGRPKVR